MVLSFVFQLLAIPYHQSPIASAVAAPDPAQIAADLKAMFGDAAALCVQTDDKGAPAAPAGDCGDYCPLCQFAAQAAALIAPDAPTLHLPISVGSETIGIAPAPGAVPAPATAQKPRSRSAPPRRRRIPSRARPRRRGFVFSDWRLSNQCHP